MLVTGSGSWYFTDSRYIEAARAQVTAAAVEQTGPGAGHRTLAARVFSDPAELEKLNAVVYPAVNAAVEEEIARWGEKGLAIDAINLIESGLGRRCGLTVAVTADPSVRLRRIMARDGIDEARARARIAAQKPDEFYRRHCGFTLVNQAGSQREFETLAAEFFDAVLQFYI